MIVFKQLVNIHAKQVAANEALKAAFEACKAAGSISFFQSKRWSEIERLETNSFASFVLDIIEHELALQPEDDEQERIHAPLLKAIESAPETLKQHILFTWCDLANHIDCSRAAFINLALKKFTEITNLDQQ